jgi:energy-coupling factor transporter ATP-binding protein EcfA2
MTQAVELRALRYRYPDGREALRGVSFSVAEGERVGLIGPNGAGKSTILQHLNGILPGTFSGEPAVRIFGTPVTAASLPAIRRCVGLLFQDPDDQLFCPTVEEDVGFGPQQFGAGPAEIRERVRTALAQVGLTGSEQRSPHHLSGGEKRRVCLAGVLACSPRVLALDEPTSDLDPRGKRELRAILTSLPATTLIASHDLELIVELCTRVIVLDAGVIVAEGPTAGILADEPLMLRHGLEKPHILAHRHPHI